METTYQHTSRIHNTKSAEIVVPIILDLIPCSSVLDVGCGTGTWLKVFNENHGIGDIFGMDGNIVKNEQLVIAERHFHAHDLRSGFELGRRFDLVLCLEVAEHLPESSAKDLIQSLCRHSNTILFSSAIPGQGGQNHLNEQWPEYWEEKFKVQGYYRVDAIRPFIWNNHRVDVWYRQNLLVYTRNQLLIEMHCDKSVKSVIHPELWTHKVEALHRFSQEVSNFDNGGAGIRRSWRAFINALRKLF